MVSTSSDNDFGALSVIGWYLGYAETVGDYMPHDQMTIVPRLLRQEEFAEYKATLGERLKIVFANVPSGRCYFLLPSSENIYGSYPHLETYFSFFAKVTLI